MGKSKFGEAATAQDFDSVYQREQAARHKPLRAPTFEPQPKGKLELKGGTWLIGQRPGLRPREE